MPTSINERTYAGWHRGAGDASRTDVDGYKGVLTLLVPVVSRDLHFASAADHNTDWNVANPVHPSFYVHSETTPATDYAVMSHDANDLTIQVFGGGMILTAPDGETITIPDDRLLALGTGDDARFSWDTTDANANELLLQMPAGGAVNVPVLIIGQAIESFDFGLYNGVVNPRIAMFGVGAVTTGTILEFRKARGTVAAPTVVTTGDDLGTIDFYGAVAAAEYVRAASIRADMAGTIATTRGPGNLSFNVATDAAPSVMTERLLIEGSLQIVLTPGTDVVVADATGLMVGATAQVAIAAITPELQEHGTAAADSAFEIARWSADTGAPALYFGKSRGAAIGTFTVITTGDVLGAIEAFGSDGVDFNSNANASAAIRFVSYGTIAADRIPGQIRFLTATDAAPSVLTEYVRLDGSGNLTTADTTSVSIGVIGGGQAIAGVNPTLRVDGTALADSSASLQRWSADANAPGLLFGKSRGAASGTFTIIVTGDVLGTISAYGADGVDFNSNGNASAEIRFAAVGTIAADRVPGEISFWTATDAAPSVLTQRLTISNAGVVDHPFTITVGTTGTRTGSVGIDGATSGTVTVTVAAAAGTWTMQLPAAVGAAGQQLTDAAGDGVTSWAAASLGAWKNDLGILDPHEALRAVVSAPTHRFIYNAAVMPAGQWAPPDRMAGVFAEEAPWAMHGERADGNGIAFSNINSFGYARAAIQALYEDLQGALAEIVGLKTQLAALGT